MIFIKYVARYRVILTLQCLPTGTQPCLGCMSRAMTFPRSVDIPTSKRWHFSNKAMTFLPRSNDSQSWVVVYHGNTINQTENEAYTEGFCFTTIERVDCIPETVSSQLSDDLSNPQRPGLLCTLECWMLFTSPVNKFPSIFIQEYLGNAYPTIILSKSEGLVLAVDKKRKLGNTSIDCHALCFQGNLRSGYSHHEWIHDGVILNTSLSWIYLML